MATECDHNFNKIDSELRQLEGYIIQLEAENERLRKALQPLAYARRATWAFADSSSPPYVVTEHSKRNANKALGGES